MTLARRGRSRARRRGLSRPTRKRGESSARYWARFSPGIVLIREIAQRMVKREAESRSHVVSRNRPPLTNKLKEGDQRQRIGTRVA